MAKRENSKYEKNKAHITNLDLNENTDQSGDNKNKKFEKIDSEKYKNKKIEKKDNANTIKDITNEKELIDIYFNTKSRGKKFRVKAKLQSLKSLPKDKIEEFLNTKRSEINEKNKSLQQKNKEKEERLKKHENNSKPKVKFDQYTEKIIDGDKAKNININKKSEQQSKGERKNKNKENEKKVDKKLLNKKRETKEKDDEDELGGMYLSLLEEKLKN
jgi:hypothetical protein